MRGRIGFIFQQFNLVGRLPVLTNVLTGALGRVPLWRSMARSFTREERELAMAALTRVGIPECAPQRASTLPGGQPPRARSGERRVGKEGVSTCSSRWSPEP